MRSILAPNVVPAALTMIAMVLVAACRPMRPPARPAPTEEVTRVGVSDPPGRASTPAGTGADSVSPTVAAIIDSIEAVVRDSIEQVARDSMEAAARRDSALAAARRDSIEAARRDSIALQARRDSIAAVARADSIAAARRDSIAAARADSIQAAVRDSIAQARADSIQAAVEDSIAAAARRDSLIEAARLDSIARIQAEAPITENLETLRELGPAYIPYDRGPRLVWDTEAQALLATTLLPVIRNEELEARTTAYFWLLVRADGTVDRVVLQTSSGNTAFDVAAERAARALLYAPAIRGDRAVPTWIIRDISLLMQ